MMAPGRVCPIGRLMIVYIACVPAFPAAIQLQEVCPYSSLCTTDAVKLPDSDEVRPCCFPCSCSDQCTLTGNCCPDKQGVTTLTQTPSCRRQNDIYSQLLNRTIHSSSPSYRVIDRCPDESVHGPNSACYKVNSIDDLMFVSDAKTFDVYLNRVCAQCNSVNNVIVWKLHVKCPDEGVLLVPSFQARDEYILNTCAVSSVPPTNDIGMHSVCFHSRIDRCNHTGNWVVYNEELEKLCLKYDYGFSLPTTITIYSNVYCYLCNIPVHSNIIDLCPIIDFYGKKHSIIDFTAIIHFKTRSKPVAAEVNGCTESEVLDPFLMMCVDLLCPMGSVPYYGACKTAVDMMNDFFLKFDLDIQLPTTESYSSNIYTELLLGVYSLVQSVKTFSCGLCEIRIARLFTGNIVATVTLRTGQRCSAMFLMKEVETVLSAKPLQIHLFETNMNISAEHLVEPIDREDVAIVLETTKEGRRCGIPIYFDPTTITCPTILYQLQRLERMNIPESTVERVFNRSRTWSDTELKICLGIYKGIYIETMSGGPTLDIFYKQYLFLVFHAFVINI